MAERLPCYGCGKLGWTVKGDPNDPEQLEVDRLTHLAGGDDQQKSHVVMCAACFADFTTFLRTRIQH